MFWEIFTVVCCHQCVCTCLCVEKYTHLCVAISKCTSVYDVGKRTHCALLLINVHVSVLMVHIYTQQCIANGSLCLCVVSKCIQLCIANDKCKCLCSVGNVLVVY